MFWFVRAAFKEWAVVVDTLGQGDQIVILRKGGIREGRSGFNIENQRFLLCPTQFHQQRESVIPSAQARFDQISAEFSPTDKLRLEFFAEVVDSQKLESRADAKALRGQHIWRDEVIAERFEWGRENAIFALAVRVYRLLQAVEIPMHADYGGCKSWIELHEDIATGSGKLVLDESAFQTKLEQFRVALAHERSALEGSSA